MELSSFLNNLILLGALQGFIVSGFLFFSKSNQKIANRYLSVLILLMANASMGIYLMNIGIQYTSSFWQTMANLFPFFIVMPMGPLIYFYVRKFAVTDLGFTKKEYLHFAPVTLDLIPHLVFLLIFFNLADTQSVLWFADQYQVYADIPRWLSMTFYVYLSFRFIHPQTIQNKKSEDRVAWVKQFIIVFLCFQCAWLFHLVPYINPSTRNILLDSVGWYPVYIPLAILIYWLGIKGLVVSQKVMQEKTPSTSALSISAERRDLIIGRLEKSMHHERLFLDSTLTLSKVSDAIDIPQKQISAVLNQLASKSFNEFVNEFRIEEFKKRVHRSEHSHLTLFGLALECGFNSQATFQRTFKAREGVSPTEYLSKFSGSEKISA